MPIVEVYKVWASSSSGPLKAWIGGYELVRIEGDTALLKITEGDLAGVEVRHPASDVREVAPCSFCGARAGFSLEAGRDGWKGCNACGGI